MNGDRNQYPAKRVTREAHVRQRERVRASLLLSHRQDRPTTRRWAR
jgi:hypothetical protein